MEKYLDTEASKHQMKLRLLGGEVGQINSKLCYVTFNLPNFKVSYAYNINKKDRYFLERINPYPLSYKDFANEADVVRAIEQDILQFKNAANSSHVMEFIRINRDLHLVMKRFEDVFLNYNISAESIKLLKLKLDEIEHQLSDAVLCSEKIILKRNN